MIDRPVREDDSKIASVKLPRHEFANLKKLCDKENKTINKKIRELINQEVNENFGTPVKVNGNKKKFFIPAENKLIEMLEVEDE